MLNYKLYNIQADMNNVASNVNDWMSKLTVVDDTSTAVWNAGQNIIELANSINYMISALHEEHDKDHACPYCGANLKEDT